MNNKGQTTIFLTLMLSVLLLFTLTALEVGRIYMSKVKGNAIVHSTCSNIMADYDRNLFEKYHLLFMDPTYGTGSEAVVEEKIQDYLESSLNNGSSIYQFVVKEVAAVSGEHIPDHNMQLLKQQITDYEKTEGLVHRAKKMGKQLSAGNEEVEKAAQETEQNAVEYTELSTGQEE